MSASRPIQVAVGESHTSCTGQSGWPEPFYKCSLSDDLLSAPDDEIVVKVTFDNLETTVALKKGQ